MTIRLTLSSKTNRFPSLNGTVNAFLMQNGKRAVLLVRYGSRIVTKNGQNHLTVRSMVCNKIYGTVDAKRSKRHTKNTRVRYGTV